MNKQKFKYVTVSDELGGASSRAKNTLSSSESEELKLYKFKNVVQLEHENDEQEEDDDRRSNINNNNKSNSKTKKKSNFSTSTSTTTSLYILIGFFYLNLRSHLRRKYGKLFSILILCLLGATLVYVIYSFLISLLSFGFSLCFHLFGSSSGHTEQSCAGVECREEVCAAFNSQKATGPLCLDMCLYDTLQVPKCSNGMFESKENEKAVTYEFYSIKDKDATYICPNRTTTTLRSKSSFSPSTKQSATELQSGLSLDDLQIKLTHVMTQKLNESSLIDKIIRRMITFVDVNQDAQVSFAEASTLWSMVNTKHIFYMLIMADKPYMPEITGFCGSFLQTEKMIQPVVANTAGKWSSLSKAFHSAVIEPAKGGHLSWNAKCKLAIGILDFFRDLTSFTPSDEFGSGSLYLCSAIGQSFASNFYHEAKLVNFDELYTGAELVAKLSDRVCHSHSDCVYSRECSTKCDLTTNKCSYDLVRPQIVDYCDFLADYLTLENATVAHTLGPLLDRCSKLANIYIRDKQVLLDPQVNAPVPFEKHREHSEIVEYWQRSTEWTHLTNELSSALWNWIKFVKDPVKKTKKHKKSAPIPK